jgi:hypothetical protein
MTNLLSNQISLELAERSEAKSAKRSYLVYQNIDFRREASLRAYSPFRSAILSEI